MGKRLKNRRDSKSRSIVVFMRRASLHNILARMVMKKSNLKRFRPYRYYTAISFSIALSFAFFNTSHNSFAQNYDPDILAAPSQQSTNEETYYIEADQLIHDQQQGVVTASGNVRLRYQGRIVEADEISYFENTGRVMATGHVRIFEKDGTILTVEHADITSKFDRTVAEKIFVITPQDQYFWARSVNSSSNTQIFEDATYTTCKPCEENPEKAPIWRIRSSKIINDEGKEIIHFHDSSFEIFGKPIINIPYFFAPNSQAKRKSGILRPSITSSSKLGYGVKVPYYLALNPSYDLTITPTLYSNPTALLEVEWRQRLKSGTYSVKAYNAVQANIDNFSEEQDKQTWRGFVETHGQMSINKMWKWGWDGYLRSDRLMNETYGLGLPSVLKNQVWLQGQSRSGFARAELSHHISNNLSETDRKMPSSLPSFSYRKAFNTDDKDKSDLTLTINGSILRREEADFGYKTANCDTSSPTQADCYIRGIEGTYSRLSAQLDWRKTALVSGALFTPFAYAKADVISMSIEDNDTKNFIQNHNKTYARVMPAVGADLRMPWVAQTKNIQQTITPIAQLIARPSEISAGDSPNEDSQSLFLDATNLFKWDKYTGFDRQEGGIRANYGIQYDISINDDLHFSSLIGQSYHIYGTNSFTQYDPTASNIASGLDNDLSNIIIGASLNYDSTRETENGIIPMSVYVSASASLNHDNAQLEAFSSLAKASYGKNSLGISYAYTADEASINREEQQEIEANIGLQILENITIKGNARYEIDDRRFVSRGLGLHYEDECTIFETNYTQAFSSTGEVNDHKVDFRLTFKSLGSFGHSLSR